MENKLSSKNGRGVCLVKCDGQTSCVDGTVCGDCSQHLHLPGVCDSICKPLCQDETVFMALVFYVLTHKEIMSFFLMVHLNVLQRDCNDICFNGGRHEQSVVIIL